MSRKDAAVLEDELGFDAWAARRRLARLAANGNRRHVLDVGTGYGSMAIALAQRGLAVTSVDRDQDMLDSAKERATEVGKKVVRHIRFTRANALKLPFGSGTFDGAFSFCALHHMRDCTLAIEEMLRVCKVGGVVAIAELNRQGARTVAEAIGRGNNKSVQLHNRWRPEVIARALRKENLRFRWYRDELVTVFIARPACRALPR